MVTQEMMAVEIEQPFGDDADDLPLEKYCLNIEENILDVRREVEARVREARVREASECP